MKITVCQLPDQPQRLEQEWALLARHLVDHGSELVLLPEMPFHPWLAHDRQVDGAAWAAAVAAHEQWLARLAELGDVAVLGSMPVLQAGKRHNRAFVRPPGEPCRLSHTKYYLPDEAGFWEASWYDRGPRDFSLERIGTTGIGFMICTELWFSEHARAYGRAGAHLLACPRGTAFATADKWVAGGRAAAVAAGAFCLSSNRAGIDARGQHWAGHGWIIHPEEGDVLALTSEAEPFITLDLNLAEAEAAKHSYPRYVRE